MPDVLTADEIAAQGQAMVNYLHKQVGELVAANANLTGQIAVLEHRVGRLNGELGAAAAERAKLTRDAKRAKRVEEAEHGAS